MPLDPNDIYHNGYYYSRNGGGGPVSSIVDPVTGGIDILANGQQYSPSPKMFAATGQIGYATYGDSIANAASYANFDLRQCNATNYGVQNEKAGAFIGPLSNGLFRMVANCGVSGETTANMITREAAGASATRKSIADAASCGAKFCVNSFGINDIQTLAAGASNSTISSVVATAISNSVILLKKQVSYGMWPITTSLLGYNYSSATAGEIATRQVAVQMFNSQLASVINSANGRLGSYIDVYSKVTVAPGAWISGYDVGDGLHPGVNGGYKIFSSCLSEMMRVSGVMSLPVFGYPYGTNLISNADFSASSSGTATGLNIFASGGGATLAKSIVDWRGQTWQEIIVTPTSLDGNGNAGVQIDIAATATTVASGDVLGGELSVYVDDGAGGAPNIFHYMTRIMANTTYADTPFFNATQSPKIAYAQPVDVRTSSFPIVSPAAAPATLKLTVIVLAAQLTNSFRVRLALPRMQKLASTY